MKKKGILIFVIIALFIVTAVGIWGGVQVYGFFHPDIELRSSLMQKVGENFEPVEGYSFRHVVFTFSEKSIFGMSKEYISMMKEMDEALAPFEKGIRENYDTPLSIDCGIEIKDGKTYITYSGTAARRDNGKIEDIYEQYVFDFVLTENIIKD